MILAVGARKEKRSARYPVDPMAIRHQAGVPDESTSADEVYDRYGTPRPGAAPPVFSVARRGSGRGAHHELCGQQLRSRGQLIRQQPEQELAGAAALDHVRLANRGQGRRGDPCPGRVVEADYRELLGNAQSHLGGGTQDGESEHITRGEDPRRPMLRRQELPRRRDGVAWVLALVYRDPLHGIPEAFRAVW